MKIDGEHICDVAGPQSTLIHESHACPVDNRISIASIPFCGNLFPPVPGPSASSSPTQSEDRSGSAASPPEHFSTTCLAPHSSTCIARDPGDSPVDSASSGPQTAAAADHDAPHRGLSTETQRLWRAAHPACGGGAAWRWAGAAGAGLVGRRARLRTRMAGKIEGFITAWRPDPACFARVVHSGPGGGPGGCPSGGEGGGGGGEGGGSGEGAEFRLVFLDGGEETLGRGEAEEAVRDGGGR